MAREDIHIKVTASKKAVRRIEAKLFRSQAVMRALKERHEEEERLRREAGNPEVWSPVSAPRQEDWTRFRNRTRLIPVYFVEEEG